MYRCRLLYVFLPLFLQGTRLKLPVSIGRGVQAGIRLCGLRATLLGVFWSSYNPRSQNLFLGRVSVHGSHAGSFLSCLSYISMRSQNYFLRLTGDSVEWYPKIVESSCQCRHRTAIQGLLGYSMKVNGLRVR